MLNLVMCIIRDAVQGPSHIVLIHLAVIIVILVDIMEVMRFKYLHVESSVVEIFVMG